MVEELGFYSNSRDSNSRDSNSRDSSARDSNSHDRVQPIELRGALARCKSHGAAIEVLTWIVRDAGLDGPDTPDEVARSIDAASGGVAAFSDDMLSWNDSVLAGVVTALDAAVMPGRARAFPGTAAFFDVDMIDVFNGSVSARNVDQLDSVVKQIFGAHASFENLVAGVAYNVAVHQMHCETLPTIHTLVRLIHRINVFGNAAPSSSSPSALVALTFADALYAGESRRRTVKMPDPCVGSLHFAGTCSQLAKDVERYYVEFDDELDPGEFDDELDPDEFDDLEDGYWDIMAPNIPEFLRDDNFAYFLNGPPPFVRFRFVVKEMLMSRIPGRHRAHFVGMVICKCALGGRVDFALELVRCKWPGTRQLCLCEGFVQAWNHIGLDDVDVARAHLIEIVIEFVRHKNARGMRWWMRRLGLRPKEMARVEAATTRRPKK
jgi:hypothetical protein